MVDQKKETKTDSDKDAMVDLPDGPDQWKEDVNDEKSEDADGK